MKPSAALTTRLLLVACALLTATAAAQRGPAPDPLVKENATVKLAEHAHVIPDNSVPMVPNVGIVIGSRATLVIDPGMGRRNGETVLREVAKASRNTDLYIATTHFHVEHTTGALAFPATARYVNSKVQEADFAEGGAQHAQAWLSAFDVFDQMRPRTIVPAHGPVGDGSILAVNRAIMQGVQTRARQLKAQGRSADVAAMTVQTEFQAQYPSWPRANGLLAAARAAYAEAPQETSSRDRRPTHSIRRRI